MKLKNFLSEQKLAVEFTEGDGTSKRKKTIFVSHDGVNKNYIIISSESGSDKISLHKNGIEQLISTLQKFK